MTTEFFILFMMIAFGLGVATGYSLPQKEDGHKIIQSVTKGLEKDWLFGYQQKTNNWMWYYERILNNEDAIKRANDLVKLDPETVYFIVRYNSDHDFRFKNIKCNKLGCKQVAIWKDSVLCGHHYSEQKEKNKS